MIKLNEDPTAQKSELQFLRFFYDRVYEALGPANDEIYTIIKTEYIEEKGGRLPENYE